MPTFLASSVSPIRAVLFDVYGTLVEIQRPCRPYRKLLDLLEQQGGLNRADVGRLVMCQPWGLLDAARELGMTTSAAELQALDGELHEELDRVRPFPEVERTLTELNSRGILVGVCSNLALPYVAPVRTHLGHLVDEAIWSCAVGALKPDRKIFQIASERLGVEAGEILMVGDNYTADVAGARKAGLNALHLDRHHGKGDLRNLDDMLSHV